MISQVLFLNSSSATSKDLSKGVASWQVIDPMRFNDSPTIGVERFVFTNYFANITAVLGNNKWYYSDDSLETKYHVPIPDGSYSVSELNTILTQYQQSTHGVVYFSIGANYSTNKVYIQFGTTTGWYVHFDTDSPFAMTGFTSGQNVPASKSNTALYVEYAGSNAAFNTVQSIKVGTNICNHSISNGKNSNVIYQTTPVVLVGSVQQDLPYNVMYLHANELRNNVSTVTVFLYDQNDAALAMSEDFQITLVIKEESRTHVDRQNFGFSLH